MPGRDVDIIARDPERRRPNAIVVAALAGFVLLALGTALGSRIAAQDEISPADHVSTAPNTLANAARRQSPPSSTPTRTAAVAAASRSITAFDGDVLVDPVRLRAVVANVASLAARSQLIEAFAEANAQIRAKLGADTTPQPVIVLRSVPVGYRIERFSLDEATIAIWYVGIVASGATVDPQQSWRTQLVSLVWERRAWKVSSFESSPGPTPPLSTAEIPQDPTELFVAIPRFEAFEHAEP